MIHTARHNNILISQEKGTNAQYRTPKIHTQKTLHRKYTHKKHCTTKTHQQTQLNKKKNNHYQYKQQYSKYEAIR